MVLSNEADELFMTWPLSVQQHAWDNAHLHKEAKALGPPRCQFFKSNVESISFKGSHFK